MRARSSGSRCAGSAIAAGPRTRCRRRSPPSGAPRARTGPSAGRARRGSTPSPGTRSSTARAARADTPAEIPDDAGATRPGPAERAEQSWVAWRVHRALEELPEREHEVIALAYWSGLSQSEVAEYLGIPLGTVKTRTRAALARLADLLGDDLEGM